MRKSFIFLILLFSHFCLANVINRLKQTENEEKKRITRYEIDG